MKITTIKLNLVGKIKEYKVGYKFEDGVVTLVKLMQVRDNKIIDHLDFNKITRDRLIYKKVCQQEKVKAV